MPSDAENIAIIKAGYEKKRQQVNDLTAANTSLVQQVKDLQSAGTVVPPELESAINDLATEVETDNAADTAAAAVGAPAAGQAAAGGGA